jgi:thiol-disulfide isomerase/thioredoxin
MQRRICFLLLLFICVQLSQAQENLLGAGDRTINVFVKNPIAKEIIADLTPVSLASRQGIPNQKTMRLDEKNHAVLKITLKVPTIVKLMGLWPDSSVSYFAMPGVNIIIHADLQGKDTAKYNDVGPAETDFYLNVISKSRELLKTIPQQDPVQYVKSWDDAHKAMQEIVLTASSSEISRSYASWISQSIRSLFQSQLSRQLINYVTITRRWPSNMEEYINRINSYTTSQFNQPNLFTRETDRELVESYYLYYSLINDWKKKLPAPNTETTYRSAINFANEIKSETSRELMLRYLVPLAISQTTDTNFLKWMKSVIVPGNHTQHLPKMISEKQNLLQEIGNGKPAPYFDATAFSGNKFSYQDFHGKYLFIDIWATWCVPCRKEIPYLELLKKKYTGKPIEFISVSVDKEVSAWKKFVESKDSKDQFHSLPGKTSSISEVFHAKLIPVFVLIDPNGKIVNPTSFRPSDPALELLLDELLKKNNNNQSTQ